MRKLVRPRGQLAGTLRGSERVDVIEDCNLYGLGALEV